MNKLVYLFELDSVRKTKTEIEKAQKKLFEEIVLNGNIVVMTMNQVSDSLGFLAAVNNNDTTKHILALFHSGVLRVSSYKRKKKPVVTTPSQYLQDHIESFFENKEDRFFFSGWFIEGTDKNLIKAIRNSLKYNDPGIIENFRERSKYSIKSWDDETKLYALEDIETFVRMILQMSGDTLSINPAKTGGKSKSMMDFRDDFQRIWKNPTDEQSRSVILKDRIDEAFSLIAALEEEIIKNKKKVNNRSDWYDVIRDQKNRSSTDEEIESLKMAEAIIDLCYNYTCEDSICGISKHYTDDTSFFKDFLKRLALYWEEGKNGTHEFLAYEGNAYKTDNCDLPAWENMAELMYHTHTPSERGDIVDISTGRKKGGLDEFRHNKRNYGKTLGSGKQYEDNIEQEHKEWNHRIISAIFEVFVKFCWYILLFIAINIIITIMTPSSDILIKEIIIAVTSPIFFGIISSWISAKFNLPDILELTKQIPLLIGFIKTFISGNYIRHNNKRSPGSVSKN